MCIALGGAFGALTRSGLDLLAAHYPSPPILGALSFEFLPLAWSTLLADLVGAFALGALSAIFAAHNTLTPAQKNLRFFTLTGFIGAFTTYGTLIAASWTGLSAAPLNTGLLATFSSFLLLILGMICAGAAWLLFRPFFPSAEGEKDRKHKECGESEENTSSEEGTR